VAVERPVDVPESSSAFSFSACRFRDRRLDVGSGCVMGAVGVVLIGSGSLVRGISCVAVVVGGGASLCES